MLDHGAYLKRTHCDIGCNFGGKRGERAGMLVLRFA